MEKETGASVPNRDLWVQDLQALLQDRQAPTEWPRGCMAMEWQMGWRALECGCRVRLQGQEQPTLNRQAEWGRDRGDQELGSQGQAPPMAALGGAPSAAAGRRHARGGVARPMFITYVNIEEWRRLKDFIMRSTSPTAQRPSACGRRRRKTGHSSWLACATCDTRGCSGSGTVAVGAC